MAAKKQRSVAAGEKRGCILRDAEFGAARVGDQSMWRSETRDFRQQIERRANRQRQVNQVGASQRLLKRTGGGTVYDPAAMRFIQNGSAVPTVNEHIGCVLLQRQRERASDEAGAENRYALNEVR
jgi:hypothetical protein